MIVYHKGDIVESVKTGIIVHGCNLVGGFGSGVAGSIARKYPKVRDFYLRTYQGKVLGEYDIIAVDFELFIINGYTQKNTRSYPGERVAYPFAIQNVFEEVISIRDYMVGGGEFSENFQIHTVKIGCGLGGLDWGKHVLPILENVSGETVINVWDF